jgi:hypothetical protein
MLKLSFPPCVINKLTRITQLLLLMLLVIDVRLLLLLLLLLHPTGKLIFTT